MKKNVSFYENQKAPFFEKKKKCLNRQITVENGENLLMDFSPLLDPLWLSAESFDTLAYLFLKAFRFFLTPAKTSQPTDKWKKLKSRMSHESATFDRWNSLKTRVWWRCDGDVGMMSFHCLSLKLLSQNHRKSVELFLRLWTIQWDYSEWHFESSWSKYLVA